MKTTAKMIAIVILLGAGSWLMTEKVQAHGWTHYEVFYHELTPYGTWIDSPEYGFVWIPDVAPGFHPYSTSGYWVNTVYGWTWISLYPWGWAPFHYGRWYYDDWYGWVWVPGNEWGPAWVSWRHCDGYYGWAPLTPGFQFSMSFNMHIDIPMHHWVFVPGRHFGDRYQERYYMGRRDNDRLYNRSTPIETTTNDNDRNTRFFSGPEVREVRKATGREVKQVAIREKNNAGQTLRNERLEIYRPKVDEKDVRVEKTKPGERYTPGSPRYTKTESTVRKDRAPKEKQTKLNNSSRRERYNAGTDRREQPTPKNSSIKAKVDRKVKYAERNSPDPNKIAELNRDGKKQYQSSKAVDRAKR